MPFHSGLATAVMLLLMTAGAQKVADAAPTVGALRSAGLPSGQLLVRLLGIAEIGVAVAFLVAGGPWAAALGALFYAGFAGFVLLALSRDIPISSCGCFGKTDTPPSVAHVALNLGSVAVLVLAAIIPVQPMGGLVDASAGVVVPYVVAVGATVYLLYGMLTALPLVGKRAIQGATPLPVPGRRKG